MGKWEKTGWLVSRGVKITIYELKGTRYCVESRKRPIRHANGIGVWYHTSYFLIDGNREEREFSRLQDAKAAAEAMNGGAI